MAAARECPSWANAIPLKAQGSGAGTRVQAVASLLRCLTFRGGAKWPDTGERVRTGEGSWQTATS